MIAGIVVGAIIIMIIILVSIGYVKAPPDTCYVVSGLGKMRFIKGGASICRPFIDRKDKLTLRVIDIDVQTTEAVPCLQKIPVRVEANVNVKIPVNDDDLLYEAAQNFLNMDEDEIANIVRPVLEGNIREIIGTMELDEMISNRERFVQEVKGKADPDLAKLGLVIRTFNVQNFQDSQGVIAALGVENETRVKKDAAVSRAENDRIIREETAKAEKEAAAAEIASKTAIAEMENELRKKKADLKQESDAKQAEADQAYNISQQKARLALEQSSVEADIGRKEREVELNRKEVEAQKERLEAEIAKKAEADRYAAEQRAEAELYTRTKQAEAVRIERQNSAEAEMYEAQKKAEGEKALAEATRIQQENEAAGIAAIGKAEAEAIRAKGEAEAEALLKKADAMKQYGDAAILEMVVNVLPQMASAIAEPMASIDNVSIIGGDANGVSDMSANVPVLLGRTFAAVKETTGLDLKDLISGEGAAAKMNRNISIVNATDGTVDTEEALILAEAGDND